MFPHPPAARSDPDRLWKGWRLAGRTGQADDFNHTMTMSPRLGIKGLLLLPYKSLIIVRNFIFTFSSYMEYGDELKLIENDDIE